MGIDSDDRLLREGIGLNDNHEKKSTGTINFKTISSIF